MLADLVDLSVQVDLDAGANPAELRRRDRAIGQKLAHLTDKPRCQLRQWLRQITKNQPALAGDDAVKTLRRIAVILFLLGLLVGWAAALGIFSYNGTKPVNVVNVLAVFVGGELVLLLLTSILALPRNLLQWIPGARPIQDLIGLLSPGRLINVIARYLPVEHRLALEAAMGRQKISHIAYGQVRKWLILQFSQIFAVGFNIGALICCLYLVTVSDLAFGWSTTLTVDSQSFHWLVSQLAWPWRGWIPSAVPSLEVIDATRYYRLHQGILPNATGNRIMDLAALGQWWQFLLMAIAFYGLLPRVVIFALSRWRLNAALNTALVHAPGALQILDRMNHALVETGGLEPEARMKMAPTTVEPFPARGVDKPNVFLINWAGINADEEQFNELLRTTLGARVEQMLFAGRIRPVGEDEATIAEISEAADNPAILVAVKAWEPPLLDFMDFLDDLRKAVGPERLITIAPVMLDHERNFIPADPKDLSVWQKRLQSRGDARIDFLPLCAEAA